MQVLRIHRALARNLVCLFIGLLSVVPATATEPAAMTPPISIFLTSEAAEGQPGNEPKDEFLCGETVYAVIEGYWPRDSHHQLEAIWRDPQGKKREVTRYEFTGHGATRLWVWLQLHRGGESAIARYFGMADDSLEAFHGRWEVEFRIDGEVVKQLAFRMVCA